MWFGELGRIAATEQSIVLKSDAKVRRPLWLPPLLSFLALSLGFRSKRPCPVNSVSLAFMLPSFKLSFHSVRRGKYCVSGSEDCFTAWWRLGLEASV